MAASGASPSSSPRLPSPPPFTEVQIGPKSPTVSDGSAASSDEFGDAQDESSTRRIRPGTKAADMASGPPLIPLSQLDSPFQLQEHLKALYHNYTLPAGSSTLAPITRKVATQLAEPPEGVEPSLWLYELCRFLTMKANNLIIAFFAEEPPCSAQTCPEMRASEWQYLCAVHDPPKSCCAIDYCCHTLDWATNILTSPKHFPSRLTLGSDAGGGPQASMRHLTNIFRRLYRIFAHAWFQHREVFWQVEGCDGLYVFFKAVCDVYELIPEDNYTVPPEAEGEEASKHSPTEKEQGEPPKMTILRKEDSGPQNLPEDEETDPSSLNPATTRRHRYSPSRGVSVTTIAEAAEDDDDSKETPVGEATPVTELVNEDKNIPSSGDSVTETISDKERNEMDKTPNIESFPETQESGKESDDMSEEVGSPGPSERNSEFVVVIQPNPEKPNSEASKDVASEPEKPSQEQNQDQSDEQKQDDEDERKQDQENEQKQDQEDEQKQDREVEKEGVIEEQPQETNQEEVAEQDNPETEPAKTAEPEEDTQPNTEGDTGKA